MVRTVAEQREEKGKKPERGKGRKVEDKTSQGVQRSAVQGREGKESIHPWKGRGAWIGEPEVCTVYKLRSPGIGLGLEQFACWSGGFQG